MNCSFSRDLMFYDKHCPPLFTSLFSVKGSERADGAC